jgi:hypothetical protein
MSGVIACDSSALMTPMWAKPLAAPPPSTSAIFGGGGGSGEVTCSATGAATGGAEGTTAQPANTASASDISVVLKDIGSHFFRETAGQEGNGRGFSVPSLTI